MTEYEPLKMKLGDLIDYLEGGDILTLVYLNRINTIFGKLCHYQAETGTDVKAELDSRETGDKLNYLNEVLEQAGVPPRQIKELSPDIFKILTEEEPFQPSYSTSEIPRSLTITKKLPWSPEI